MTHSHRKAKSRFEYFRMDVPARHRAAVGKTSWQHSLETSDPQVAAIKRAEWTAFYKAEVKRLDDELARHESMAAEALVDAAIARMVDRNGSPDAVMVALLNILALHVRSSWGVEHAQAAERHFRISVISTDVDDLPPTVPVLVTDAERDRFALQAKLFEGRGATDGFIHQQLARRLLAQEGWPHIEIPLLAISHHAGEDFKVGTARYNAVAKHFLYRLAEHRFGHWPEGLMDALSPLAGPAKADLPVPSIPPAPRAGLIGKGNPVSEVFVDWRAVSKAREKSKDEFATAINQFIDLFGDMPVQLISRSVVKEFSTALLSRPTRPAPNIRRLPLRDQIALAAEQGLPLVSPKSAKKALQALKSVLAHAVDNEWIESDPSLKVSIQADDDMGDDRLPFDEDQLQLIFSQPTLVDPDVDDDTIYWFFLLAPFTGCRGEELAQLRPYNVRCEGGVWFIAIERDRKAKRQEIARTGGIQKGVKTKTSLRKIPLHPLIVKAGFLKFVEHQKARDAEWLFDNMSANTKYPKRYTALSQKLNRRLRSFGIADSEFVFHSFRHSLKRFLRDDDRTKEEISDLLTGHSFAPSVGRKYGSGAGLRTLNAAIARVTYPEVDWGPVVASGLKRVERLTISEEQ